MIPLLKRFAFSLLGRQTAYRLGRASYQKARGDVPNDIKSNGESLIQSCVLGAWRGNNTRGRRLRVFDVGANVGDWSAALLRQLPDPTAAVDLHAFEPVPSTFEFLKNRLAAEKSAMHFHQIALSSVSGERVIHVAGQNSGTNAMDRDPLRDDMQQIAIGAVTAAEFCRSENIQHVHLFKCDAEGHDMEVIRGALPLLAEGKVDVLQFEYNHRWIYARNYLRDAFAIVENLPYRLAKLQADHLLIFTSWHPELEKFFEGNYALIHADALKWFPTKSVSFDRFNTMRVDSK